MFTGLIDHYGTIAEIVRTPKALRVQIICQFKDLQEGESIAVDGICLTAIEPKTQHFFCDISPETLRLTTAQEFVRDRKVNLERALRIGNRLGGHWVTGHVDQHAQVHSVTPQQDFIAMQITGVEPPALPYLIKKGSIALNGVSLTINEVSPQGFQVLLIPHTLERTNLHTLQPGDSVNLEFDCLAKTVFSQLQVLTAAGSFNGLSSS